MSDEQIPSSSYESIRSLLEPQPYMVFCDKLREFTSREFESLVADLFREMGADATLSKNGPDEAIDILCKTAEGDYIVQCKKWKGKKVGVKVVREVYGVAKKKQAKGAFIVTVSEFTDKAVEFTIDRPPSTIADRLLLIGSEEPFNLINPPVGLIDGKELFDLMNQHMPTIVTDIIKGRRKSHR